METSYLAVIKVAGIGGGGINAIDHMAGAGVRGAQFIAVDTDREALQACDAERKIAIDDFERAGPEIVNALVGADMVFITCGEGGGTGTGAAPVIAEIAKQEIGALTVGAVTKPFKVEGKKRMAQAEEGIQRLRQEVDTLIVVPNEKLLHIVERRTTILEAFREADDILRQGVQGITDLITIPGLINLDFADVRLVMHQAGSALMGVGHGSGESRALEAAKAAITSPLLERPLTEAKGILMNVTGGEDLGLFEVNEAAQMVMNGADSNANGVFGAIVDPAMDHEVRVTVIASGFEGEGIAGGDVGLGRGPDEPGGGTGVPTRVAPTPGVPPAADEANPDEPANAPAEKRQEGGSDSAAA